MGEFTLQQVVRETKVENEPSELRKFQSLRYWTGEGVNYVSLNIPTINFAIFVK
jgi:hypothetical protein